VFVHSGEHCVWEFVDFRVMLVSMFGRTARNRVSLMGLVFCGSLAFGLSAVAQPVQPPAQTAQSLAERDQQARAEFLEAREYFARGNYLEAVRRFEHSFQLSGRVELLHSIGTSYDRLHRWTEARDAFRRYLEALPNAPERDEIRARLAVIDAEIERERTLSTPRQIIVRERQVVIRTAPVRVGRIIGITAGALTVGSAVVAATIGGLALRYYNDLLVSCGNTDMGCPNAVIGDIQLRATMVNLFIGVGVALAVTSVVALIVDEVKWRSWQNAQQEQPGNTEPVQSTNPAQTQTRIRSRTLGQSTELSFSAMPLYGVGQESTQQGISGAALVFQGRF